MLFELVGGLDQSPAEPGSQRNDISPRNTLSSLAGMEKRPRRFERVRAVLAAGLEVKAVWGFLVSYGIPSAIAAEIIRRWDGFLVLWETNPMSAWLYAVCLFLFAWAVGVTVWHVWINDAFALAAAKASPEKLTPTMVGDRLFLEVRNRSRAKKFRLAVVSPRDPDYPDPLPYVLPWKGSPEEFRPIVRGGVEQAIVGDLLFDPPGGVGGPAVRVESPDKRSGWCIAYYIKHWDGKLTTLPRAVEIKVQVQTEERVVGLYTLIVEAAWIDGHSNVEAAVGLSLDATPGKLHRAYPHGRFTQQASGSVGGQNPSS